MKFHVVIISVVYREYRKFLSHTAMNLNQVI